MTTDHCFICAGADDDPGFDECAVCGRKGHPLLYGSAGNRAVPHPVTDGRATGLAMHKPGESDLGRAIRLARGTPDPEDVPGLLQRIAIAKEGTT